jgi:hypothetical protein
MRGMTAVFVASRKLTPNSVVKQMFSNQRCDVAPTPFEKLQIQILGFTELNLRIFEHIRMAF